MYEISETDIQDYKQKWLEAERALALNWIEPLSVPLSYEPIDPIDKNIEPLNEPPSTSKKKVARTSKQPSVKRGKQPVL